MSNIDKQALRGRYSPKPAPECHICGAEMTIQRMSAGRITYGCTGATYDDKGCHYAEGRSIADDHYEQSRVTVVDVSDPDVLALLDELEAEKERSEEFLRQARSFREAHESASEIIRKFERNKPAVKLPTTRLWAGKIACYEESEVVAMLEGAGISIAAEALLDENIQLQREKDVIEAVALALRDDMRDAREQLAAAERRIAELDKRLIEYAGIATREAHRVAELEARTVNLPAACADDEYFIDGVFQALRYERDIERAIIAAGIKVKGE